MQPYHQAQRPRNERREKRTARTPEFEPGDRLSQAWLRKEITVDEYIRYSLLRVAHPDQLPAEFRQDELPDSAGLALGYALSLLEQAKPKTRQWVQKMSADPEPRVRRDTAAPWVDCGQPHTMLKIWFTCKRTFTAAVRIEVSYRVEGTPHPDTGAAMSGLPAVDVSPMNGVPDGLDKMIASLTVAAQHYTAMGYGLTGDHVKVFVGFDQNDNPGMAFPFGGLFNGGPVILLPSDPAAGIGDHWYTYLPRHELFHAFQYHYLPNLHLGLNLPSLNWWMEATAEWATRQVYRHTGANAPGADAYARQLDAYLSAPDRAINAYDGLGGARQYGLFPLATYLTERTHADFVLRTWKEMDDDLPLEAIERVVAGYGRDIGEELRGYMVANYRLDTPVQALSDFLGASSGYKDPHAKSLWRERLDGDPGRPRAQRATLAWNSATSGTVSLQAGGTHYVEISPPAGGRGRVTVKATGATDEQSGRLRAVLVVFPLSGNVVSMAPRRWVQPDASGRLVTTLSAGEVATLMLLRADLIPNSYDAEQSRFTVTWNASLTPESGTRIMVVGDSITHGSEGDFTWRYRLAQHFTAKGVRVDFVGPRRGTYDKYVDQRLIAQLEGRAEPPLELYPGPSTASYRDGNFDSDHNAMWGWTYNDARYKIKGDVAAAQPEYLVVALGFNDIAFWGGADATIGYFKEFVAQARAAKPDLKILVSNVINRTELSGYEWLNPAILAYKAKLPGAASSLSTSASPIHVVDINTGFHASFDTYDGVHPNGVGEYKYARVFADAFAQRFSLGSVFGAIPGIIPDLPVTTPAWVTATPTGEGVTIRWARVFGASGYYIHTRDATTGENFQKLPLQVGGDHWINRWVSRDHRYEYMISSARGTTESAPTGVAAAVPNPATPPQTADVHLIPGDGKITVSWTATPGVSGYQLYGMSSDGVWLPTLDVTGTTATYSGLTNGHIYNIAVSGVNGYGAGMPGSGMRARPGYGAPPTVEMLDAWSDNHHEAHLAWQESFLTPGYWIERMDHTQANPTWSRLPHPVTPAGMGNPAFTVGYLMNGATNYSFRVIPANGALQAAPSAGRRVRYVGPSPASEHDRLQASRDKTREMAEPRTWLPLPALGLLRPDAENCYCATSG